MLSAVTLSRSPPRADTTMMATVDRSRICLHSSNPSTSGSIRSSSTMSGCSVSSSDSALLPSVDTSVSNPRTARLDLIRSTMFGSSSTMSTRVGMVELRSRAFTRTGFSTGRVTRKQVPRSAGSSSSLPPCAATIPLAMDSPSPAPDPRSPRPDGARRQHVVPARVALAGRLGDGAGQLGRQPLAVVGDPHGDRCRGRPPRGDDHLRPRRVMPERVADQVDEHLLKPVMVGPDGGQPGAPRPSAPAPPPPAAGPRRRRRAPAGCRTSRCSAAGCPTRSWRSRAGR